MIDIELDYFYGKEAEQFNFYRLPKILFTDIRYSKVSAEAKILYGLLLDRMCLSLKNGWVDNDNRVYIYFTLEDAMEMLNVGKDKGVKLFAELDCAKGCGLIRRKKQGLGKPAIIYVMNFISKSNPERCIENAENEECDLQTSEKTNSKVLICTEAQTSENSQSVLPEKTESRVPENRSQEVVDSEGNDNDNKYNNINNTYVSDTYPILSYQDDDAETRSDAAAEYIKYAKLIADNIDYDILKQNYGEDMAAGVLELMTETVCSKKTVIVVASQEVPQSIVKSRLLKLDYTHIEYVFDCLKKGGNRVKNIKSYMLAMLYNSYATIGHYYTAEVAADSLI